MQNKGEQCGVLYWLKPTAFVYPLSGLSTILTIALFPGFFMLKMFYEICAFGSSESFLDLKSHVKYNKKVLNYKFSMSDQQISS